MNIQKTLSFLGLLCALHIAFPTFASAQSVNANDDAAATFMNTAVMLLVLSNDIGNNISMQIVVPPSNGTASVNVGNSITYTPTTAYTGTDFFTYRITDTQSGISDIANVTITVQSSPLSVVTAVDDVAQTVVNTPVIIAVLGNDIGAGISLSAIASLPQHGAVSINPEGSITYTPDANFVGTDNFAYLASGGGGATDIGNVSVSVIETNSANNPPYSVTLEYCAAPMQPVTICNEFFDPDGNDTHVDVDASSTTFHCSLNTAGTSDSCLRYTPLPGFTGNDTVHIVVCDDQVPAACSESIAIIHVTTGGCTQPIAIVDNATISNGLVVLNGTATPVDNPYLGTLLGVLHNDENVCGGTNQLSISNIIDMPNNGTAQIIAGQILYDPNTAFSGTDVLQYVTCNACGLCDTTTLNITVNAQNTETCEIHDNLCIAPFTTVEICPEFCTFTNINASDLLISESAGSAQVINGTGCVNYIPPTATSGTASISFTACNSSNSICETYTIHITLDAACGENPPIAQNDAANAIIGQSSIVNVLQNDNDPEGEALTLTHIISPIACGTAEIAANQLVFFADNSCPETVSIAYTVCDPSGLCDTATLVLTLSGAIDECENITEYCTIPFNPSELSYLQICANFCDLGEGAHITDANTTFHCSISLLNDSCFTYLPLPGFTGTDQIEAYACDNAGACDTLTFTVHVGCTIPIALNDNATTNEGQAITLSPLNNDSDPCGNVLTPTIATQPQNGTVIINADNTFSYTPNEGYIGTETFSYNVCTPCASGETCDNATITIAVTPIGGSQTPIANNDNALTEIDQAIEIMVLTNDSDPDNPNNELNISTLTQPNNGSATITANNSIIYEPNSGFSGTDVFTYTLCDPSGECSTATVTVTVSEAINAQPDIVYTTQGNAVAIYVMTNDQGQNISVSQIDDQPNYGNISNSDLQTGLFNYQPQADFVGIDYFTYTICNQVGNCETTLVSIIVTAANASNQAPIAASDQVHTPLAMPIDIYALDNDIDPNNDLISMTGISQQPINGNVVISPDGQTITYTPNGNNAYCDNFSYIVCDNNSPALCDTAYIQVIVGNANCGNQAPIANDDSATVQDGSTVLIPALDNDSSSDDNIAYIYIAATPQYGTATINNNDFVYTPNDNYTGTDYFVYVICDESSPSLCDTAYVTITVTPQAINAQPDIDYTNQNTAVSISVLANDEGTQIALSSIVSNPDNGAVQIDANNGTILYEPNSGFSGVDYFEYQICNPSGDCAISLATVYVVAGNDNNIAPNAVNDSYVIDFNGNADLSVLSNDNDPLGGDTLVISSFTQGANGTVSNNDNGTLHYIPNNDFSGIDTFSYIICDNGSPIKCDTAMVVLYVTDHQPTMNLLPIALNDLEITQANTPIYIHVLANDSDPEGDSLTITWISEPANGIAHISADSVHYIPESGFIGTDYFAYIICDNGTPSLCDTAYITIIVEGEPAIITYEMNETTPEDTPISICPEEAIGFAGFTADNVSITAAPVNGIVGIDSDTHCLTYIPNAYFNGSDSLSVNVCNATDVCFPVIIYINVTPLSNAPIAENDSIVTDLNTAIDIAVLNNDYDPDNDAISAVIIVHNPAQNGATASINTDLSITYLPPTDFVGTDSFAYIISDATGELSDTAWVFISITSEPQPEIDSTIMAINDTAVMDMNTQSNIPILNNDTIANSLSNIAVSIIDNPSHGTASILLNGSIDYTPNFDFVGNDSLVYTVCGITANGNMVCDTALVIITISGNNPPIEECGNIKFATGFSPNGDATNDLFLIEGADDACISNATLLIFNRWGDVVYRAENYQNAMAWNGTLNNNSGNVPDTSYFFLFKYNKNGATQDIQGCFELKR